MGLNQLLRAAAFAVIAVCSACAPQAQSALAPAEQRADGVHRETVVVQSARGPVTFYAEIADDEAERARGLMFRREMAREHGMLFLFEEPAQQSFWMRNTHLSLDLIFITEEGRILNIVARATPYSDASIRSRGPAIAVLEINGGLSEELGLAEGDQVSHPFFRRR